MNRDGIAEPRHPDAPETPTRGGAHVWRVELPATGARAAARAALREILAAYLGLAPEVVGLTVGKAGKPTLADRGGGAPLAFNLSHSGGLALVAVTAAGTEVGIDVERLRPRRDLARLAARWLPTDAAEAVAGAPDEEREATFYAVWTALEARTKCTGAGLSGPPPGPEIVATALEIDHGYAAAIAADPAPTPVQRFEFARLDHRTHG